MAELPGGDQASYIDYETFLAPEFDPFTFANSLVLATNDPNDTPLDLSTPLSRVLFDIQEIDSHIDVLTNRSAIPLLTHTRDQTQTSGRILADLDPQIQSLNSSYKQLEKEVAQKHAEADEVRQVALRLWETLRLGRAVGRCLQLGRQLEVQYAEFVGVVTIPVSDAATSPSTITKPTKPTVSVSSGDTLQREDHRALIRCAHTILGVREIFQQKAPGEEGHGLGKVDAIGRLQTTVISPVERSIREAAERTIREFSLGSASGTMSFSQAEEAKAHTVSALITLYLISPTALAKNEHWSPSAMLQALESYLRAALQSSITALARSLASLPSLDNTLGEVSARCQNIVALELVLADTKAPAHPLRATLKIPASSTENTSLLQPLLARLETGSLPSYFWRTLASSLSPRVQDILSRGGVAARSLRANRSPVSDAIRECVLRGMQPPPSVLTSATGFTNTRGSSSWSKTSSASTFDAWHREIAVMVGSIIGHLGR